MQMPEMDGIMLTNNIRKLFPAISLPLIMLSSMRQIQLGKNRHLFIKYISKPVKASQLFDTLVAVLATTQSPIKQTHKQENRTDRNIAHKYPLNILLAEDNVVNQKVATKMLERLGYRVDVVADGAEAVASIQRQPYDVILMDIQMPEMDGVTATRLIREAQLPSQQPHIIALTANALLGDREKYMEAGMNDYLSKPVRLNELKASLLRFVTEKEAMIHS